MKSILDNQSLIYITILVKFLKKMSITTVTIPCVHNQYTAEYIANVLWRNKLAKVSKITLMPYLSGDQVFNTAYILIDQWVDSEIAYNIINRLKNSEKEARIVHNDDESWIIEINTHNDGNINIPYCTTSFDENYFTKRNPGENVIQVFRSDNYMTFEEATIRINKLKYQLKDVNLDQFATDDCNLKDYLYMLEEVQDLQYQIDNYLLWLWGEEYSIKQLQSQDMNEDIEEDSEEYMSEEDEPEDRIPIGSCKWITKSFNIDSIVSYA